MKVFLISPMNKIIINRIIHWSFTAFIIFYIMTGFGISHFQIITPITFGLLSKPIAFQLHSYLIFPFIILLILHILITLKWKSRRHKKT